jgi:hypothetical protein
LPNFGLIGWTMAEIMPAVAAQSASGIRQPYLQAVHRAATW